MALLGGCRYLRYVNLKAPSRAIGTRRDLNPGCTARHPPSLLPLASQQSYTGQAVTVLRPFFPPLSLARDKRGLIEQSLHQ